METKKYSKSINGFEYSGDITIKLAEGDRIYSEQHYHNTGCRTLFNFFSNCLAGDFNAAKSSRPCKIVLFKAGDGEQLGTFNSSYWTDEYRISSGMYYDSAVTPGMEEGKCETTFHFRLPFLALNGGTTVSKLGLYPDIISFYDTDLCAYKFLDRPIEIPEKSGNYTIIIDWTLKVTNINSTESNQSNNN